MATLVSPPSSVTANSGSICSEEERGLRLHYLLEEGTKLLRKRFLQHTKRSGYADLETYLKVENVSDVLLKLKKKNFLKSDMWDKIYPTPPVTVDVQTFDITLLCLLLTNLGCNLDSTTEGNIKKLRSLRNEVSHKKLDTSQSEFDRIWSDISTVLFDLGGDINYISSLKNKVIDKNEADRLRETQKKLKATEENNLLLKEKADQFEKVNREGVWHNVAENITNFTGRDKELAKIHEKLQCLKDENKHGGIVLHGCGGVGKTEIAIKYCRTFSKQYHKFLWINMESESTANSSYSEIAEYHLKQDITNLQIEVVVAKVYQCFSANHSLFIFDNANDSKITNKYMPTLHPTAIKPQFIMTSQVTLNNTNSSFEKISIDPFTLESAEEFIRKQLPNVNISDVQKLAEKLGYLPLALQQGCSYIKNKKMTVEQYLINFTKHFEKLFKTPLEHYEKTVLTTSEMALEALKSNENATDILKICSCLNGNNISKEIFYYLSGFSEIDVINATSEIASHSILKEQDEENIVIMHSLTSKVVRLRMEENSELSGVLDKCFDVLKGAIDDKKYPSTHYKYGELWLHHVIPLVQLCDKKKLLLHMGSILSDIMKSFENRYLYSDAEYFLDTLLKKIKTVDEDENDTLKTRELELENLIKSFVYFVYVKLKYYEKAIECFRNFNPIIDAKVGRQELPANIDRADFSDLLNLPESTNIEENDVPQHSYKWKRFLLLVESNKRAIYTSNEFLDHFESIGRIDNDSKARIRYQLGMYYKSRDNLEEALIFYKEAYDLFRATYGDKHIYTLEVKFWIGCVYMDQCDIQEAFEHFSDVYRDRVDILGEEDNETLIAKFNKAMILIEQNKSDVALSILYEIYDIRCKQLGVNHKTTMNTRYKIALLLYEQRELHDALKILTELHKIEQIFGKLDEDACNTKKWIDHIQNEIKNNIPSNNTYKNYLLLAIFVAFLAFFVPWMFEYFY